MDLLFVDGCKPTYEGLKAYFSLLSFFGLRGCKPTYEGLKASQDAGPAQSGSGCKPTYEGLKEVHCWVARDCLRVLQAYL